MDHVRFLLFHLYFSISMQRFFTILLLSFATFAIHNHSFAADTTRVLFIGNSFTYQNMVPDIVKGLATAGNIRMEYAMHAPGGATIGDTAQGTYAHMENPAVFALIKQGKWNYVVVQDNQGRFIYDYGVFHPACRTIEGHKKIMDSVLFYNPCAQMVWFAGWAWKNGNPPYGNTGTEIINRIDANYQFMNDSLDQIISPIGAAWKKAAVAQTADLWDTDQAHASPNGSYVTGAVLFCTIFRRNPQSFNFNNGLPAARAADYRRIAYETVMDSFQRDNLAAFTLPLTHANGTLTAGTGYVNYAFYSNGAIALNGASNTGYFPNGGCYQAVGTAGNGCKRVSKELCFAPVSIPQVAIGDIGSVYPNPAASVVTIALAKPLTEPVQLSISDLQGRIVLGQMLQQQEQKIDISMVPAGTYLLRLSTAEGRSSMLLQKQ